MNLSKFLSRFGLALRSDLEKAQLETEHFQSERGLLARGTRREWVIWNAAILEAANACRFSGQDLAEGGWGSEGKAMSGLIMNRILDLLEPEDTKVEVHDAH